MHRFVILASVAVLAAATANCARGDSSDRSASSLLGPSAVDARNGSGGGGKGGGASTSSLTLVMYTDVNANGLPNWGDTVTFGVSTTATSVPYVNLACYQNSVRVASGTAGFFASYPWTWEQLMTLSSRTWTGGAAECKADLGYYGNKGAFVLLTSLSFHVDP